MDRDQFLDALSLLVEEDTITEQEAADLLRRYDAGEITAEDLPVPQEEMFAPLWPWEADFWTLLALSDITIGTINNVRMQREAEALGQILSDMGFQTDATGTGRFDPSPGPGSVGAILENLGADEVARRMRQEGVTGVTRGIGDPDIVFQNLGDRTAQILRRSRETAQSGLNAMSVAQRRRTAYDILDIFRGEAGSRTSQLLFSDRYNDGLRRWQTAMRGAIRGDILTFAELGKGAPLDQADLRRLQPAMQRQMAHLQRFAEEIAAKREAGNPMSEDQVRARLRMYSGDALSEYYRAAEAGLDDGFVVRYNAIDDNRTCMPCIEAEEGSPYLPGRGPFPGADTCLGRGHCRCTRIPEFSPSEAERLRTQRAPA